MSIDQNIYIGAYLEVTMKPIIINVTSRMCPDHGSKHLNRIDDNYCSICGKQMEITTKTSTDNYLTLYELLNENYDDNLISIDPGHYNSNKLFVIPNGVDNCNSLHFDNNSSGIFELPDGNIISKFIDAHRHNLSIIEHHIAVEITKYKQGVIVYYS